MWGLDSIGRDRDGYNKLGYDRNGRDRDGFDREGYDEEGYDRGGYDQNGYDREGNRHDFFEPDENGFYGDGRDQYGFDEDGFNHWGLDCNGYDKEGYDSHNFDRNGRNKDGYNRNGKDPQGYNRRGYQEQPDGSLRDREGFDRQGFDEDGYTSTGYDKNGRDKDGNRRDRRFTRGKSGKRLKANFCKSGWDQDGYDRWGFHNETGLTAPDEETGHQRNWLGWIYDPEEEVCYNPDNPNQKMAWSKEKNRAMYIKPAFNSRYRRGGYLTDDGLLTGRSEPRLAPTYEEMGHVYTPPDDEIDHHKRLSFEEFRKRRRFYASEEKLRHEYRRFYTNNLTTKEEQEQYLRDRWRKSKARVDAGGGLITAKGCLLRCPHCGQYMSPGKSHRCPNFNDRAVYVAVNGRVTADNWSGELLADPNIDDPQAALMYPDGYNIDTGYDQEGYDRQGYDFRGFNRDGYNKQGYDRLGYDKDGYDQQGYNRQGVDRKGEKKPATLESVASFLSDDDLLDNEDLADLYSRVATGLVGAPRSVYLEEGGGFGTDMRGKIKADPYPLGRNADPRSNLVVTRAGIHHELGHELFTDPEQWAQVLEIAKGKQEIEGLSPDAAQILPHLFNVVEDGRMERALSEEYAGVSEVLAASCRLEERWDGRVGAHVPMLDQVFGASLYRALPFYARPDQEKKAAMNPQAREIYEKFSPLIDQAVSGSSQDAFRSAVAMSKLLAEESGTRPPNPDAIKLPPLPPPPKGTKARTGNPKDESGQGRGRPKRGEEEPSGQGRGRPKRGEETASGQGRGRPKRGEEDESGQGRGRPKRAEEEPSGQGQGRPKRGEEEPSGQGQSKRVGSGEGTIQAR